MLDQDDERAGFDLGATGRLALMAKLAEGTGMKIPEQARNALNVRGVNMDMPKPKVNIAPPREEAAMPPSALCSQTCLIQQQNANPPGTRRSGMMSWRNA